MTTTTRAIAPRHLETARELLAQRKTAFEYLRPGRELADPASRADRIADVTYCNEQLEALADRLGIEPAELVTRAEAMAEAESN